MFISCNARESTPTLMYVSSKSDVKFDLANRKEKQQKTNEEEKKNKFKMTMS